ncbi:Fic family protein [Bifidobacterium pseudocatenulatum]|uniref:Fic family protein n=1 Tax=Bifidobacterium pseudocatenulatum TaxID=28026 RepID=UPI001CFA2A40|nr:Fic family protein [Bifidobacterium pseudocatenulatum]MCB4878304.1 Fic family protein [Bifidobacterium pseudocatenulatum]MCB4883693.1 Fic family protein [Bifidobacterium pseudocatenulatum]MCB4889018.1 Fic family protein [Bifidobacterium pseudocatenulatum]MCB4907133.1 Fic family protein [Bifidobacterium pseudocatenulatum]
MSMEYRTLARLFHADRSMDSYANHDRLARQRLEADSTFTTGIGTPLGELFIATPRCVCMLTQKVLLAERQVSAMWRSIPGVMRWNYIYHAISEELLATNEMEGVRSTRKETEAAVAAARQARTEGDMEKARFGEFAKLYLNLTNRDVELPKTLEDIRDIYDKIALDEIDDKNRPDGELFRKGDVEVQGPHGTVIHSGVSSEARISALLAQMMDLARSDTIPFLQRAIASHFLFEYIHPFYDGNGRTGRYLLALYLSNDLTLPTVLSLSRTIAENKNEYYKAFTEAEDKLNSGELTFFVYTILGLIERAQESLIEELGVKIDQLDKATVLRDELRREHALSTNATLLLYAVMQEELFDTTKSMTLEDAGGDLMLTKQTIRKYVDELAGASLIEFTGRRPLRFRASGALRTRIQAKREWGME